MRAPHPFFFYIALFIVTGAVATTVRILADRLEGRWAGVLLLAPTVTVLVFASYLITNREDQFANLVKATVLGLPALILFLALMLILPKYIDLRLSLLLATTAWFIAATITTQG